MEILGIVWFCLIFVLIAGYFVLDGFDLGAGVLSPFVAKTDQERAIVRQSIGPVWDGNEVWLLTAGGALFAAFPAAYATTFSGFYLAVMLVLMGLIVRAAAVEFAGHDKAWVKLWNILFFVGSLLPARVLVPMLLGNLVMGHGAHGRVVTTLTCSACINREAERLGCETTPVPVGFSRIYRETLDSDVIMGVEEYGGVCVPEHLRERDGLLVCLLAVEMLARSGKTVSQMTAELEGIIGTMSYARRDMRLEPAASQAFRNVLPGLNPGELAGKMPVEVSHADGLRAQFDDDSWVLIRPSRTSAVVRVYAEAPTSRARDELLTAACELVRRGI